jgi:hypothetical protein
MILVLNNAIKKVSNNTRKVLSNTFGGDIKQCEKSKVPLIIL